MLRSIEERNKIVTENIKLVHYVLYKMELPRDRYEDAFQNGCVGLIKAAENWDGIHKFSTIACAYIRNEIRMARRDYNPDAAAYVPAWLMEQMSASELAEKYGSAEFQDIYPAPEEDLAYRADLNTAMEKLSPEDRCIIMKLADGYSKADMMREFRVTFEYIKKLIARLRKELYGL